MEYSIYLIVAVILVAFLYSSVGHGGASGYLALLSLAGVASATARPTALILNVLVAGIAFLYFHRAGFFNMKLFIPLIAGSIPMSLAGSFVKLEEPHYKIILGICLIIAVSRVLLRGDSADARRIPSYTILVISGMLIGFISGMIGIGGGILLSPLLVIARWADLKQAAGISALFIVVNSVTALSGLFSQGFIPDQATLLLAAAATAGGVAGAFSGSRLAKSTALRILLSAVLLFAGFKLIFIH